MCGNEGHFNGINDGKDVKKKGVKMKGVKMKGVKE